ncbi:MAG: hypothetical protein HY695_19125 [Deltaproteobacteria bacterium]|nr:hypothetical protein [Deltaproteobacteria bacterium]
MTISMPEIAKNDWVRLITSGLVGASLVAGVSFYNFNRQMNLAIRQQQISLSRDLAREFYQLDGLYRELRTTIESCQPLYKQSGGKFSHDQINRYLGFFDDLGFYLNQEALTIEIIDHLFGAYLIEAFEHPEIRRYISLLRTSMDQPGALKEFEQLAALLENDPRKQRQVQNARAACKRQP